MYRIYRIKEGDTLESILKKFNTTATILKTINGIVGEIEIIPGNYLIVPMNSGNLFSIYEIKRGDTLYRISKDYGLSVKDLTLLNGIDEKDYIYPGQELIVPNKGVRFYLTKKGDSLKKAADILNTNPAALLLQNENIYLMPEQLLLFKEGNIIE